MDSKIVYVYKLEQILFGWELKKYKRIAKKGLMAN